MLPAILGLAFKSLKASLASVAHRGRQQKSDVNLSGSKNSWKTPVLV